MRNFPAASGRHTRDASRMLGGFGDERGVPKATNICHCRFASILLLHNAQIEMGLVV
jgi:hypothetical protein